MRVDMRTVIIDQRDEQPIEQSLITAATGIKPAPQHHPRAAADHRPDFCLAEWRTSLQPKRVIYRGSQIAERVEQCPIKIKTDNGKGEWFRCRAHGASHARAPVAKASAI